MRPILPVDLLDVEQSQIGFVDRFGRLHAAVRPLAVPAPARNAPPLVGTSGINASRAVSSPSHQALKRTVTSWVWLKTAAF
jgi:hypothetical protein